MKRIVKITTWSIFTLAFLFCLLVVSTTSCGGPSKTEDTETEKVDDAAFNASQPLASGLYDADYYDIVGKNARKGKFDGRIYFALSPALSAINVFENGNRTKIDYTVIMEKPFEKNDSGIYVTVDNKNRPVCIEKDTASYFLKFVLTNDTVTIGFNPKPRHESTAVEIMEKIKERKDKK